MWILVAGELAMFTILFGGFVAAWSVAPTDFKDAGRTSLPLGVINTVVLLTSSALVATGVHAVRIGDVGAARRRLMAAVALGVGFIVVKAFEYGMEFTTGLTPATNSFWMYYFVITGMHLVHVIIGLSLLVFAWRQLGAPADTAPHTGRHVESVATYWHMVDVLWVLIFPLVYLAAR